MMRQEILERKKKLLKNIAILFLVSIILLVLWIVIFKNGAFDKGFKKEYISFKYDSTWKVNKSSDNSVSLTHDTKSIIDIKVTMLTSNHLNSDIENIKEEVRFDIEKQNVGYNLLKQEKKYFSKEKYEGYKLLYEDGDAQALVVVLRNDNYLCVINFTSNNNYFDILLDSFQLILGSIEIKE